MDQSKGRVIPAGPVVAKMGKQEESDKDDEGGQLVSANGLNVIGRKPRVLTEGKNSFMHLASTNFRHVKVNEKVLGEPSELSCIGEKERWGKFYVSPSRRIKLSRLLAY